MSGQGGSWTPERMADVSDIADVLPRPGRHFVHRSSASSACHGATPGGRVIGDEAVWHLSTLAIPLKCADVRFDTAHANP